MQNGLYLECTGSSDRNVNIDIHREGQIYNFTQKWEKLENAIAQKNNNPKFTAS